MNKRVKAKWVKALRSGKYRQISNKLQQGPFGRCCLGVLRTVCKERSRSMEMLSQEFCEKVGIDSAVSGKGRPASQGALAKMNDQGKSFSEIADYIDANL